MAFLLEIPPGSGDVHYVAMNIAVVLLPGFPGVPLKVYLTQIARTRLNVAFYLRPGLSNCIEKHTLGDYLDNQASNRPPAVVRAPKLGTKIKMLVTRRVLTDL